jgi:hypothetical protein
VTDLRASLAALRFPDACRPWFIAGLIFGNPYGTGRLFIAIFPESLIMSRHVRQLTTLQGVKMPKHRGIDDQLKGAIADSGLTLHAIAKTHGLAPDLLYRCMAGERDLRLATAAKICAEFNLELVSRK